jgi:hypothetical protein
LAGNVDVLEYWSDMHVLNSLVQKERVAAPLSVQFLALTSKVHGLNM